MLRQVSCDLSPEQDAGTAERAYDLAVQVFLVKADSLLATTYYIGVFNMDYYIHQPFSYTLEVSPHDPLLALLALRRLTPLIFRRRHVVSLQDATILCMHAGFSGSF